MQRTLRDKLIAGAVATLTVLTVQWFDLAPAALAASGDAKPAVEVRDDADGPAPGAEAKAVRYPIRGKLKAVDTTANTITLTGNGKDRVFKTTPKTEIIRQGKPSTLAEAVTGEEVGGLVERQGDGTLVVLKVRFGPKTEEEKATTTPKRKTRSSTAKTADVR